MTEGSCNPRAGSNGGVSRKGVETSNSTGARSPALPLFTTFHFYSLILSFVALGERLRTLSSG